MMILIHMKYKKPLLLTLRIRDEEENPSVMTMTEQEPPAWPCTSSVTAPQVRSAASVTPIRLERIAL